MGAARKPEPRAELDAKEPARQHGKKIDAAMNAARSRIAKLDVHAKIDAGAAFAKCLEQMVGLAGKRQLAAAAERGGQLSARANARSRPLDAETARLEKELHNLDARPDRSSATARCSQPWTGCTARIAR